VLALVALAAGPLASTAEAATFSVTTAADAGPGSLRAALIKANATAATDTITFAIAPSGVHVITLATLLPAIIHAVVIDAKTQPGFAGAPLIQLDNGTGVASAIGLDVAAGSSTVSGLAITRFGTGIRLRAGDGNTVSGSWLGLDTSSAAAANTVGLKIVQASASNRIGGTTAAAQNVISGNTTYGVELSGAGTKGNLVRGNRIGTDPAGTTSMSDGVGIVIHGGANGNRVGGTTPGARNLVSGNLGSGISLFGSGTTGNLVAGNRIGTNAAGTASIGNSTGVRIEVGASANTVGGPTADSRNLISGNDIGMSISGAGASSNTVSANFIGTDASGKVGLGNIVGLSIGDGATGNTIGGTKAGARNVISGNSQYGVWITSAGTSVNRVQGNRIGTNAAGTAALGNGDGIHVDGGATGNFVGGATAGAGNLISGNGEDGVDIADAGTTHNRVRGNRIGTNALGTAALRNSTGVRIEAGADGNTVGGTTAAERNVISGNGFLGICLCNSGPMGNTVSGNYIGTNASGTAGIPNASIPFSHAQVYVVRSTNNTIGGAAPGAGNIISGNHNAAGVELDESSDNVVAGNRIGTNAAGTAAIGNGVGVSIASGFAVQSLDNVVGGTTPGSGNLISGNGYGLYVQNPGSTGNTIAGNKIGTNAAGTGPIPNDRGINIEADAQATVGGTVKGSGNVIAFNAQQGVIIGYTRPASSPIERNSIFSNGGLGIERYGGGPPSPVITSIHTGSTTTTIKGMLDSAASTTFRIELFASPACDPSGHGEGKLFLGAVNVVTDGSGHASFSKSLSPVPPGRSVTATATTDHSDTSEFSACVGSP
jgi:parallel beta-helix repeat protein